MLKLLIAGTVSFSKEQLNRISALGYDITSVNDERIPLNKQDISCDDFDAVVCNGLFLYNDIKEFTKLKFIQLTSAGYDRVPLDYINENGIRIKNAAGVYSVPMAEFALCGVLQLYKQSRYFTDCQAKHLWDKHRGLMELYGKTVCIVGCGNIGTECAKRFSAFGCRIVGVDICMLNKPEYSQIYNLSEIKTALSESDIIVLTLPLTDKTKNMFNTEMFDSVKDGAVFVNIARGGIVETNSLVTALKQKLFGAVIDVFENEPLDEKSLLWDIENLIITPHNCFIGDGNNKRLFELIISNLTEAVNE